MPCYDNLNQRRLLLVAKRSKRRPNNSVELRDTHANRYNQDLTDY